MTQKREMAPRDRVARMFEVPKKLQERFKTKSDLLFAFRGTHFSTLSPVRWNNPWFFNTTTAFQLLTYRISTRQRMGDSAHTYRRMFAHHEEGMCGLDLKGKEDEQEGGKEAGIARGFFFFYCSALVPLCITTYQQQRQRAILQRIQQWCC